MNRGLAALQDPGFRRFFLSRALTMITGSMSSIALAFGWLIGHVDAATLLVTSAIIYAVVALGTMLIPSVWRMGRIAGAVPEKGSPLANS